MKLEETIQDCFDEHPASCGTREQVLVRIICMFGTGYVWQKGQLVEERNKNKKSKGKFKENEKAIQYREYEDVVISFLYEAAKKRIPCDKEIKPYNEFLKIINASKDKEELLKQPYAVVELLRNSSITNIEKVMCRKYSPIFNIPDDITSDWKEGIEEVKLMLIKLNVDLSTIK